jgi:acetate kinase
MTDVILVINAGSSSIKFSIFSVRADAALALVYRGMVEGIGDAPRFTVTDARGKSVADDSLGGAARSEAGARGVGATGSEGAAGREAGHEAALRALLNWIDDHDDALTPLAAGHRVVHGGARFVAPVLIDAAVTAELEKLVPLAPLHQPHNLAAIRAVGSLKPGLPQIACFDTAFHQTQPPVARAFALPRELTQGGIERYGFHGLSYEYIASVLPDFAGDAAGGRVVVAHLGNGASLCAMRGGRSVATTMAFTALDGVPMGTRSGALDPGVVLYLMRERGLTVEAVSDLLYHHSGLLGMSGISGDMRELLASDSPEAARAIDVFVYRIGHELGSLTAALGGLDVLVFTAGIGQHAPPIRARVCQDAGWLGLRLDEEANRSGGPRISRSESAVSVWVIPTDEELMIARHTHATIGRGARP